MDGELDYRLRPEPSCSQGDPVGSSPPRVCRLAAAVQLSGHSGSGKRGGGEGGPRRFVPHIGARPGAISGSGIRCFALNGAGGGRLESSFQTLLPVQEALEDAAALSDDRRPRHHRHGGRQ